MLIRFNPFPPALFALLLLAGNAVSFGGNASDAQPKTTSATIASPTKENAAEPTDSSLVQIALLLDTSGSMKGLVDQARCQLWNVVTELGKASRAGQKAKLQIAVYQYGTETVSKRNGCLRRIIDFTDDLDEVSRALFSLKIGGGDEYCGQVIDRSLTDASWSKSAGVYKAVFIAGNESFDQGSVKFGAALPKAWDGATVVNSIYCFDKKYKEATVGMDQWESAARLTEGLYFQINHNHHLPNIKTPFDARLRELNQRMNETFIWYGKGAGKAAKNQQKQDRNAANMSDHAFAARMSAKIGHLYHHVHDDLVDALDHGAIKLNRMPVDKMPEQLQVMTEKQRGEFVEQKIAERNNIRRQMAEVIAKRHAFLSRKMPTTIGGPTVLGDALINAVRAQAIQRGFQFADAKLAATK